MSIDQMNHYQRNRNGFMGSLRSIVKKPISRRRPFRGGSCPGAYSRCAQPAPQGNLFQFHRVARVHVCYCDGIGCNASTKTALKLLTLGFQVRELIGGLDWWKRDGYATSGTKGQSGTVECGC